MKIQKGSKLLFIGDSITDCGRARPVGEGAGLGDGYVSLVDALLMTHRPDNPVRILNVGISGNRVTDLKQRWQEDVSSHHPDWLAVMIGINDVWRQFDSFLNPARAVDPETYRTTLDELIVTTRPSLEGLVLMTPYYIEVNRQDPMRKRMDEYGLIVKAIAETHDAIFVDTQAAFDRVLEHVPNQHIAWDRVHPGKVGHMIIARAFCEAIGATV